MRSSSWKPAAWAALSSTTSRTVQASARGSVMLPPGMPTTPSRMTPITNACRRWDSDPALTTSSRFGNDCWRYERGSSAGSTSSRLFIPMMRTYAPPGMTLNPYSVSPRWNDQIFGPKPMKNSVTFMPDDLAVT